MMWTIRYNVSLTLIQQVGINLASKDWRLWLYKQNLNRREIWRKDDDSGGSWEEKGESGMKLEREKGR